MYAALKNHCRSVPVATAVCFFHLLSCQNVEATEIKLVEKGTPCAEGFAIVNSSAPQATIVVARQACDEELFAAAELQTYVAKASGVKIPIRKDHEKIKGNIVAVGRNRFNSNSKLGFKKLGKDGFRIKTDGKILSLVGSDSDGTQYAVYTFLEDYLGVRWLWPGELGEVVPQASSIAVGPIDRTEEPDFVWRDRGPGGALWGAATGPTEMHARELVLGVTREHQEQVELWEKRNKWGGMKVYGGHVLGEIFTPEKYAKTHPEYFSLIRGKRAVPGKNYDYKHGGQVCTTNPEVIRVTVQWVRDFFDKHPDYGAVHVSMNDGLGFCQCATCRALDSDQILKEKGIDAEEAKGKPDRNTSITDRIFTFANQVAEQVQKTHPGKLVMNFAYSRYSLPPEKVEIHPLVIPQYCFSAYSHASPKTRARNEKRTAAWAAASQHTAIYEYYINGSWPSLHRLAPGHIAESIKVLHEQGYVFYQTQSGDEFAINGINYYVAGRLLWDSSLDEREIRDDFYRAGFGKAADSIKRFHNRLIAAWNQTIAGGKGVTCGRFKDAKEITELFTPELLSSCRSDLDEAEELADSEPIKKRVAFYRTGLHYTKLTVMAVRATMELDTLGIDLGSYKTARQNLKQANREEAGRLMRNALEAWRARDALVEQLKNDYVLAYLWVRYNDHTRSFNQTGHLQELLEMLKSQ